MALQEQINWVRSSLGDLRTVFNGYFEGKDAFQIFVVSAGTTIAGIWIYNTVKDPELLHERIKAGVFHYARKIPYVANQINIELTKVKKEFASDISERYKNIGYITRLPKKSLSNKEVLDHVTKYLELGEYDWSSGFVSGAVYHQDAETYDLVMRVYGLASYTNPLHPDVFPGVCKMEAEVVRMACSLFQGDSSTCGTMTTGGTESILMAMKACRDYAWQTRSVSSPEIVMPVTAHPAFNKASQYFGIRLRIVPVDPETLIVNPRDMARKINKNTIVLVGSAPNFPYGTMDNIPEIAALGLKFNIPVHVDMCLGGFVAPFMAEAGFPLPHAFDFSVPGVTSISADTHKYGYAPKGSSVVLYSKPELLHSQFSVCTDWPGGVYGSPTVNGSRAGGTIAACWATMLSFGREGYVKATKEIITAAKYIEEKLRATEGIFVFGTPATTTIAIGSNKFEIYLLMDAMTKKGWHLNALQHPSALHITVTNIHTKSGVAQRFINDIEEVVPELILTPASKLSAKMAIYGAAQSIPDKSIVGDFTRIYLECAYYTDNSNPHDLLKEEKVSSNGIGQH